MRPEEILPSVNWMGDGNDPIKGFSWKYGRKADTKGILFWPDVFLHDAPLGEKIAIILMDTQGLFEIGSTPEENARIFGRGSSKSRRRACPDGRTESERSTAPHGSSSRTL